MIEIRINELLGNRGRSFYWLANETGISHTTLWRLKKGKALGKDVRGTSVSTRRCALSCH
jgi:DNA-binding Xre family transcriptional regulator